MSLWIILEYRIELLNWIGFSIVWIHDSPNTDEVYLSVEINIIYPCDTANALGGTIFYRNVIDSDTNGSGRGGLTKGHEGARAPGPQALRGPTQDMKRKIIQNMEGIFVYWK